MMPDVVVEKLNNVYLRVNAEDSIIKEMAEFFTFTPPNSRFAPEVKKKHWDGKIRLLSLKTRQIYVGLERYIREFCRLNAYTYEYEEEKDVFPVDTKNLSKSLSLPVETRDYQHIASSVGLTKKRTVLVSPTASGKSLIIYLMVRHLLNTGKRRGLLIVPTVNLVNQMHSDFKEYSVNNGWDVDKHCQKIHQGQSKIPDSDLIISTWQSIYEMPKNYFAQFDFIIGDEAHTFAAKSLTAIMKKLVKCDVRIGTTGTLSDAKVNRLVLEGLFGPVFKVISTKKLMDRKQLSQLNIKTIVLKYPEEVRRKNKNLSYHDEMDFLVGYESRNRFISNLAVSLEGNTLVLFNYVKKHGLGLYEQILAKSNGKKVFLIHGGVEGEEREQVRQVVNNEKNAIVVASYGTFSTGVNIPNLHNVIFASPTKSKIRTLQSIGRSLRLGKEKTEARLFDIADDLRIAEHTNHTLKHYEHRVKIYIEEQFSFSTVSLEIK